MAVEVVVRIKLYPANKLPRGSYNMETWGRQLGEEIVRNMTRKNPIYKAVDTTTVTVETTQEYVLWPTL